MGSLASRPKAPKLTQQQPAYIPVYSSSSSSPASASSPGVTQTNPASTPDITTAENIAAQARSLGLLDRTRGRISTVLTGFRGVLSQGGNTLQRKTLLGE